MANTPDYKKFRIRSKRDPSSKNYMLADYDKDLKAFENAIKSALPKDAFYYITDKNIDQNGQMSVEVVTYPDNIINAKTSVQNVVSRRPYKGGKEKYELSYISKAGKDLTQQAYSVETAPQRLEADKKQREEDKKNEQAQLKEEREDSRIMRGLFLKLIGTVTVISDVTRRILSAVLNFATQSTKDMITAHNLSMPYESVRKYRHVETIHGLDEGTITGGIADVQNKFGNITSLDEKALESLAIVMGGKVNEMVKVATSEQNPEKAMAMIIDAFNERANSGYNSVGQYVGEANARRELYSYLLKLSPQWADIFATMQEEQHNINSLFRNQADTFEEWRNLLPTARGNSKSMDYNVTVTLGEEWNQVKETIDQIRESFFTSFAPALLEILRRIQDSRLGMSETQNRERNRQNKEANLKAIESTKKTIADMEEVGIDPSDTVGINYYNALKQYLDELEKANKGNWRGNIPYAVRTPEELRVLANSIMAQGMHTSSAFVYSGKKDTLVLNEDTDFTVEEMKEVLASYTKIDEEAERKEYISKKQAEADKLVEKRIAEEKAKRKQEREEETKRLKQEGGNEVTKNKDSPHYRNWLERLNVPETSAEMALAQIEKLYAEELAEEPLKGANTYAKLVDAVDRGFAFYPANRTTNIPYIKDPETPPLTYTEMASIRKQVEDEVIKTDDEAFYNWLYAKYAQYFLEHITEARIDKAIDLSEKSNVWAEETLLRESEATDYSWLKKIPEGVTGGFISSRNEVSPTGMVTHVIELKAQSEKGEKTVPLISVTGMKGFEGNQWARLTYDSGGQLNLEMLSGQGMSNSQGE